MRTRLDDVPALVVGEPMGLAGYAQDGETAHPRAQRTLDEARQALHIDGAHRR